LCGSALRAGLIAVFPSRSGAALCAKLQPRTAEERSDMDKSMLHHYEQELRYLRELAREFAGRFPKIAGRLGMADETNADPHVERLFQGFAFFAGRVRKQLEAEFPAFSEALLESVYPHHLKPTPSMAVVQFQPTPSDSSLMDGFIVPRGTPLRARCSLAAGSVCQYNTAHAVQLWPIAIESVEYTSVLSDIADLRVPARDPIRALLRVRLRLTAGRSFSDLSLRSLPLYVNGSDETSAKLYEAMVAHAGTLVMRWGPHSVQHVAFGDQARCTRQFGLDDEQALLPDVPAAYRGHRLLHEYFAFPGRFRSVELLGLAAGVGRCSSDKLDLIIPLKHHDPALEGKLALDQLQLFSTPVINLFSRRIVVAAGGGSAREISLLPDRTQPLSFEVHSVTHVAAQSPNRDELQEYPKQHQLATQPSDSELPRYTIERRPRLPGDDEQRAGSRGEYVGTETLLQLSEPLTENRQLVVDTLCTNRDLPLLLAKDRKSSFTMSTGAPVDEVRLLAGPSAPRFEAHDGETTWRLVNYLQLNYLSLNEPTGGSAAMREVLALYARIGDPTLRREVDGLREIRFQSVIGPYPQPGPRNYVRGLEIHVVCEEHAFAYGSFGLASALSAFFARYASIHSFTQTVLHSRERGEVYRWPAIIGLKPCL
jgi:type VI secretion system protein ImpG